MTKTREKWLCATILFSLALDMGALVSAQDEAGHAPRDEPKFESKVNVVLVPVLVLDRQGHAVGNLTQRDFRIFDKGKPQVISGFTVEKRAVEYSETRQPLSAATTASYSSIRSTPANVVSRRFIAFLFDDLHLSSQELVHVRAAGAHIIAESLTATHKAAVLSTSGRTNTGFTFDHAKLQDAISNLRPVPALAGAPNTCPPVDHYAAYMILKLGDPETLDAVMIDAQACSHDLSGFGHDQYGAKNEGLARAEAEFAMAAGEHATHTTLDVIKQVVRQMSVLPGQRTLILISPGLIALTPDAMKDKRATDVAAQRM